MPPGGGGMGMKDDQGEMGGMSGGEKPSMSTAPADAMGMCCMGEMGGMSGGASGGMSGGAAPAGGGMAGMNAPSSAMPGQPGASHLYHMGSTGFFLNHSQHITLTADQRFALNRLKEKAMLDRASEQRKIDQGEQELYTPDGRRPARQLQGSGKNRRDREAARRTANEFHPSRRRGKQGPHARSASGADWDDGCQQEMTIGMIDSTVGAVPF